MQAFRRHISIKGLLVIIREHFKTIKLSYEPAPREKPITLTDCLMSALAMFGLKFPALLTFDNAARKENSLKHNLSTLYHVQKAPCDTYMREMCDIPDPREIRNVYKKLFTVVQRGKDLEQFEYLDKHYLLAGDGTGFFSSPTVHCENCCVKHHHKCHVKFMSDSPENPSEYKKNTYLLVKEPKESWQLYYRNREKELHEIPLSAITGLEEALGDKEKKQLSKEEKKYIIEKVDAYNKTVHPEEQVTYYHNMFCAAIVHPDKKTVLPFAPEPIMKADGSTKNDCERNAAKRLYADARREHPFLKLIVVEDSIASNVPHLLDLKEQDMRYIVGCKPGDHKFLFTLIKTSSCTEYTHETEDGTTHRYRYINQVQLNNSHPDFKVNFVEYWEKKRNGDKQHFSWVTDISITNENVYHIMRGGRANWRIENNTFNTLKNQDYHFSHNFGHGDKNLCTNFGLLMMLAFFIDQVQELGCTLFKKARAKFHSRTSLWDAIKRLFREYLIKSWEDLFHGIIHGHNEVMLEPNTS